MNPEIGPSAWERLEASLTGTLLLPDHPDYESARFPARPQPTDPRPAGIVIAADVADVTTAIGFARRHEIPMVPRSGGHCYAGRSSTPGLVVDVAPMNEVRLADGRVTVGAGTRLGKVYETLGPEGLALPIGTCPAVGVAGHVLGGGLGFLGRRYGLASDRLVAAELVLADGTVVWCDSARDPDLYWALRGSGGGQFGVVTTMVFEPVRRPATTSAFHLMWPYEHAAAVVDAWQAWAPQAADELVAELVLDAPADPRQVPEVSLFGMMLDADVATTSQVLAQLIDAVGVEPTWVFHEPVPYEPAVHRLNLLGGDQLPGSGPVDLKFGKSEFYRRALPKATISALVERLAADRTPAYGRGVTFFAWGGAYNRVPVDATAFAHRAESFMLFVATVVPQPTEHTRSAARAWLDGSWRLTHPYGTGGVYPNFPDPTLEDAETAYHGTNLTRLRAIKRHYDPDNQFRFDQSIQPADAHTIDSTRRA